MRLGGWLAGAVLLALLWLSGYLLGRDHQHARGARAIERLTARDTAEARRVRALDAAARAAGARADSLARAAAIAEDAAGALRRRLRARRDSVVFVPASGGDRPSTGLPGAKETILVDPRALAVIETQDSVIRADSVAKLALRREVAALRVEVDTLRAALGAATGLAETRAAIVRETRALVPSRRRQWIGRGLAFGLGVAAGRAYGR